MSKKMLKHALLLTHVFIVCFLIFLYHMSFIHLALGNFIFITALITLGALYRPRWAFWFFIGLLPLEIITLTPEAFPLALRPYQIVGFAAFLGYLMRALRSGKSIAPSLTIPDIGVGLIVIGGFLALIFRGGDTKQFIVLTSFVFLYILTRVFVQKISQLKMPLLFMMISTLCVALYTILESALFVSGALSKSVMVGRPNATFTEADWLGMFLSFAFAIILAVLYGFHREAAHTSKKLQEKKLTHITQREMYLYATLYITLIAIILTVARSAWLGSFAVLFVYSLWMLYSVTTRKALTSIATVLTICSAALITTLLLPLTTFEIGNRAASTASGAQEITIACDTLHSCGGVECAIPESIQSVDDLVTLGCRHIDLEDIDAEKSAGYIVTTTQRPDPNISVRKEVYVKSWDAITGQPLLGVGWGKQSSFLGSDASGTPLNTSNIFLEAWLGSGILGFAGILLLFGYALIASLRTLFSSENTLQKTFALFILLALAALITTNMFNAGIFLGFLWVYFGLLHLLAQQRWQ